MQINTIYNEKCAETIQRMKEDNQQCNIILTSPPYNTSHSRGDDVYDKRYDSYNDIKVSNEEYLDKSINLFNEFDNILAKDGVILYNLSYGSRNSGLYLHIMSAIEDNTPFAVADTIIWHKPLALPNNISPNKLTRLCEFVFVLCRKSEYNTFQCNKQVSKLSRTGQKFYFPIYNYIQAKNNDGSTSLNKAAYSSDLCLKLLDIYAKDGDIIYDPFIGTGTTAVAALLHHCSYIGSEISEKQCDYANERIKKTLESIQSSLF